MKVLILACLVALALARETVESLSSSEESITEYKDEHQDKIYPSFQPQPLIYPFVEPIPYGFLPQNILPLAQPAVVLPVPQPEIMEVPKAKDTVYTKGRVMPVLKSPTMPFFDPQIPKLTDLENLHLPLPLLQPLMQQVPQPIPQTLALPPQSLWSVPQPKVLPIPQQVPYPQRAVPVQALLLNQELLLNPTHQIYPVTQPLAPVHNPISV
ncbi:beta-casein isoform X3 [Pan troglodytes]|uniref:beta-casein isoform X3 n=1 Tax=Pan troglodytes TaxID=9598 RepID=UPI0023F1E2AF|nr:beta-casein isoform X3 [Pan troglodytes]